MSEETGDLLYRLWASDEASALTNQAARTIESLEKELAIALNLISEVQDYLTYGGYLGQDTGIVWQCQQILGKEVS